MELISDILLGAGALGAAVYCIVLSRRLSRFGNLESGVGGAVAALASQVDGMTRALDGAREAAVRHDDGLAQATRRAEGIARRLEILLAAMHDLPDEAAPKASPAANPPAASATPQAASGSEVAPEAGAPASSPETAEDAPAPEGYEGPDTPTGDLPVPSRAEVFAGRVWRSRAASARREPEAPARVAAPPEAPTLVSPAPAPRTSTVAVFTAPAPQLMPPLSFRHARRDDDGVPADAGPVAAARLEVAG